MKAKRYLNQIRWLTIEIETRRAEIRSLREELYGITAGTDAPRVDGSTTESKVEKAAIRIVEAEEQLAKTIMRREATRADIEKSINQLVDPAERTVLILRYREMLSWEQIADRIHYTARTAQRIHGRALAGIETILKDKGEKHE